MVQWDAISYPSEGSFKFIISSNSVLWDSIFYPDENSNF